MQNNEINTEEDKIFTKEIKCSVCKKKTIMVIQAETQEGLDLMNERVSMMKMTINRPCINCMDLFTFIKFFIRGRISIKTLIERMTHAKKN